MGQIIALADFRKKKLKDKLFRFAHRRDPVIVETKSTTIAAMRIFCRDLFVVLIDKFGYRNSVDYSEITDVTLLPVVASGGLIGARLATDAIERMSVPRHVVVSFRRPSARP